MATTIVTSTAPSTTLEPSNLDRFNRAPDSQAPQTLATGVSVRLASRSKTLKNPTAGLAPGYLQANLIVLPSRHASDFRNLCARNPVPCPLLAETIAPGRYDAFKSYIPGVADHELFLTAANGGSSIDIRTDIPRYNIYRNGKRVDSGTGCTDIKSHWDLADSVAFLIGCSFSFETALCAGGLTPQHLKQNRNVPMYRTNIPLCPAGVFYRSNYIVSMRMYRRKDVERVREITRLFGLTHGEPVDWGWDAVERLGIADVDVVDFGDGALTEDGRRVGDVRRESMERGLVSQADEDGEIPVFWACGVTPQEAVMRAGERIDGVVMGHTPGHMLVLDVRDEQILR